MLRSRQTQPERVASLLRVQPKLACLPALLPARRLPQGQRACGLLHTGLAHISSALLSHIERFLTSYHSMQVEDLLRDVQKVQFVYTPGSRYR